MTLAIHGGAPLRTKPFPAYRTIGAAEKEAAQRVLDSGVLSAYLGCWDEGFYGGTEVRALEAEWAAAMGSKHAVAVNSATSGLYAAMGAAGVGPGDEVIVSPYTMSASAVAPRVYGATPVFADVEPEGFCLDPAAVEAAVTPRTKVVLVVDIFGMPYDRDGIQAVADKHGLVVVEDAAQAIGAKHGERYAGALADMGIYSLNYHKHIHCGEGGVIVTDDDELATRLQLIRNHAEAVVGDMGRPDLDRLIGFNYRMPEIEAAISRTQLQRVPDLIAGRQANAAWMAQRLSEIPCLRVPAVREACTHAWYVQPVLFDADAAGVHRDAFVAAVRAELPGAELREREGALISGGYVAPLYWQPIYQRQAAEQPSYARGSCPVTERLHTDDLILHEMMYPHLTPEDLEDVARAFERVWEARDTLREVAQS